jgi:ABC-type multidrug transport system ATPase subunit
MPCSLCFAHRAKITLFYSAAVAAASGPSGSGKSTLLNALALRLGPRVKLSGQATLNGRPYSSAVLKQVAGYVMQGAVF